MPVSAILPSTVRDWAHKTRTGDLAWKKEDVQRVLSELVRLHLAAPSGEIWVVYPNGRISGDIPYKEGGPAGVYHWGISRNDGESWVEFVQRAALNTQEAIGSLAAEEKTRPEIKPLLRYNLSIYDEDMHNEFRSKYRSHAGQS